MIRTPTNPKGLVADNSVLKMLENSLSDGILYQYREGMSETEGYLSQYDTIRTRAGSEWLIQPPPASSQEEVFTTIDNMSGAYLNAARLGRVRLDAWHASGAAAVPRYEDDASLSTAEQESLEAFGASSSGRSLFPFNAMALRLLAAKYLTEGGRVVLKPRDLIKHVLQSTLKDYRHDMEAGMFPPAGFHAFDANRLGTEVIRRLSREQAGRFARYAVLFGFWGGTPKQLDEIRLPAGIYRAFGLDPLNSEDGTIPATATPTRPDPQPTVPGSDVGETTLAERSTPQPDPAAARTAAEIERRLGKIDDWIRQRAIIQNDARWIRNQLLDAIDSAIDWERELLASADLPDMKWGRWIYLPHAQGGDVQCTADNALFTLCRDDLFDRPADLAGIRRELAALVRFHHHRSFDYEQGDEDRPCYAALVERAIAQALPFVRAHYGDLPPGDPVPAVAQALLVSARLLNAEGAHQDQDSAVVRAIFAPAPGPFSNDPAPWPALRRRVAAERERAQMFLKRRLAARQGTGSVLYALDGAALQRAIGEARQSCRVTEAFPGSAADLDSDGSLVRQLVDATRPERIEATIRQRQDQLREWGRITRAWLGDPFEKTSLVAALSKILVRARNLGAFRADITYETLSGYVERFRDAAVTEALDRVARLDGAPRPAAVMSALSQVPDEIVETVEKLRDAFDGFLDQTRIAAENSIRSTLTVSGLGHHEGGPPADPDHAIVLAAGEVDAALERIDQSIRHFGDDGGAEMADGGEEIA